MRKFSFKRITGCIAAAYMLSAMPANAATELLHYQFNFTAEGPVASHTGYVTVAHDQSSDSYNLEAIQFTLGSTVFTTANAGVFDTAHFIMIGGSYPDIVYATGPDGVVAGYLSGVDDFSFKIEKPGFNVTTQFLYTLAGSNTIFEQLDGSVTQIDALPPQTSAVPEPSAWAMTIVGFGAIGATLRRRGRSRPELQHA